MSQSDALGRFTETRLAWIESRAREGLPSPTRDELAAFADGYAWHRAIAPAPPTTKPSGEAVAWIWHYRDGHKSLRWRPDHDPGSQDVPEMGVTPLYTHPSPTKEPDPCSIEGMIASERRKEGPK